MSTNRISIVVPCFNSQDTIEATLDSIHRQSMADWEAVVVDDGSHDCSLSIAQEWARRDDRCCVVTGENRGVSAARNRGIELTTSDWVCFIDSDDVYPVEFLERMLRSTERVGTHVVHYCGTRVLDSSAQRELGVSNATKAVGFEELAHGCPFQVHSVIVPRTIFSDVGVFDVSITGHEDWDYWCRVARYGYRFIPVSDCWVGYRMRGGGKSRQIIKSWKASLAMLELTHDMDARCGGASPLYKAGCGVHHLKGDHGRVYA